MDWLSEQCKRIQEQKLKQEKTIRHLKQLFKAWPAKAESEDVKLEKQTTLSSGKTNEQHQDCSESLTSAEKEGLLMMDKLLSKAQKARDIQRKSPKAAASGSIARFYRSPCFKQLEEPKKPRNTEIRQHKTRTDNDNHRNDKSIGGSDKKESQSNIVENARIDRSNKQPSENLQHKITAVKNKPVSSVKPQGKGLVSSSARSVEKSERTRISHRPQSSSGSKKVVPVHVNAPFQTNPHLTSARLQTTYRAATAKTSTKSRGASSAGSKGREGKGTVNVEKVVSRTRTVKNDDRKLEVADKSNINVEKSSMDKISTEVDCAPTSTDITESVNENCNNKGALQEDMQAVTDNLVKTTDRNCQDDVDKDCDKLFNLKTDGASLSVPNKLKKLVYQNRKLRQKLYTQNVTQKVNSPVASTEFPEHLQCAFGDEDAQLTQLQAKQAQHITQTYTSLLHMLESLHLEDISADSDPADIYYSKKMVEYILQSFQEMEQNLHTTDFRKLGSAVTHPGCSNIKLPLAEPSSMSVWYNKTLSTEHHSCSPVYQYQNYKQLERYMDTVYKLQLLQLQIDAMEMVARLLLPLLQTLNPGTSEFTRVLRAGYSFMSVNHNHMPVVVMDTIQDDSLLHNEED